MKRTTVFFDEQIERELHAAARRQGRPIASVVREAIEQYLVARRPRGRRALGFLGIGASGEPDTAERHEELLWAEGPSETDAREQDPVPRPHSRARTRKRTVRSRTR